MIQSAGIVVVDWNDKEPRVLCVRAYSNWDFPKGKLDSGETHLQAAIRELEEETSLSIPSDAKLVGLEAPPITYGRGKNEKTATYYLADRVSEIEPFLPVSEELGKPENDEYRWVLISNLYSLMPARLKPVVEYIHDWISSGRS